MTQPKPLSSMLSRRGLLAGTTALGATLLAGTRTVPAASTTRRTGALQPGIQLYTLRDPMAKDPIGTLTAVAGMGYREVEFAGYHGLTPEQVRDLLTELELSAPSTHIPARVLRDNPQALIDLAAQIGHHWLTIGWIDPEDRQRTADWRAWAKAMNRAGALARDAGLRVAYHNHDFELLPTSDGALPLQILLQETDPETVDFELDFYWVAKAGQDIIEVLSQAPERFTLAHLKDMDSSGAMADLGQGTIDFKTLLAQPAAAHIAHGFVERDDASEPFKSAAISRQATRSILTGP